MNMRIESLSMAVVATLHQLTRSGELQWHLVHAAIHPAPGAVASPSQFETLHKGARFLLFEEEQHRYHPDLKVDVWLKRYVIAMYDEQVREIWHSADAYAGVSLLHAEVRRRVTQVEATLESLLEPDTLRRYAKQGRSTFASSDVKPVRHLKKHAWFRRLWLAFLERFYWRDILAARERMVIRKMKEAAHA